MYGNLISRMGQQFGYPDQQGQYYSPNMGYTPPNPGYAPPKGMPTAPANPPKSYMPQWQGMGQRAEFGANFGADRGRNALLQMFQNRFRPQQQPYGIAPIRQIY